MASNLDVFKRIIFKIPSLKKIITLITGLGLIYGVTVFFTTKYLNTIILDNSLVFVFPLLIFILPAILSGELYYRFLPDCSREWSYFIGFFNENILLIYGLILSMMTEFPKAWDVFWLAMITIFLSSLIVLLFTFGYHSLKRIILLSLVQPLFIVMCFHFYFGRYLDISLLVYAQRTFFLGFTGGVILLGFLLAEYLIGSNLEKVSILELSSGMILKNQGILNLGQPVKPNVQTLSIHNLKDKVKIAIPWIHPGPLEGFGGGRMTSDIIEELNEDGEGFFFHVPSTHKSDPSDPEDTNKSLMALKDPKLQEKSSKMIKINDGPITFYGRRIGDQKIVFMEEEKFGDYDISIFQEIIDLEETTVIDLHNHEKDNEPRSAVSLGSEYSKRIRKNYFKLMDKLNGLPISDYEVGFDIDLKENPIISLIEEVENQKVLILGIEDNGIPKSLMKLSKELEKDYDIVLLLSTDTHESIHKMISKKAMNLNRVKESIKRAENNISKGSIGFTNNKAEQMNLLMDDYLGLIYSINILIRLLPLSLVLLYIVVIIWMI